MAEISTEEQYLYYIKLTIE